MAPSFPRGRMIVHDIGELDRVGVTIPVDAHERRALARVSDRLGIEWRSDGSARVYSRGFVGGVVLSDTNSIRVTTKVPVPNVLHLAGLAYRTLRIPAAVGSALLGSEHTPADWLAVLVITQIEALVFRGLRREYVVVEEELPYIRGRIRFDGALSWAHPELTACEFADFLPDTPANQLLRTTLEDLLTRRMLPGLRARAEQLMQSFGGVAYVRPSRRLLDACRITRLNQHYRPAVELCRLFLQGLGLELKRGGVSAPAFFFPMEDVFQEAVTSILRSKLPAVSRQSTYENQPIAGGPAHPLSFAPDIVVHKPPVLVIDTKYANAEISNQYGGLSFRNRDVYQALFYAVRLRCPALLVYPRADRDIDVTFSIEGVPVSIVTVDLRQAGLPALDGLVQRVAGFQPTDRAA
jgi:5-methylcytosine-specific restriction enzyme subunit McrC